MALGCSWPSLYKGFQTMSLELISMIKAYYAPSFRGLGLREEAALQTS